jgi:hypothetical protein
LTYSTARLCSGGGAFEAVPRPRVALDLARAKAQLEEGGVPVVDARVLLLVRLRCEATFKTRDPAEAEVVLEELCRRLGLERAATGQT